MAIKGEIQYVTWHRLERSQDHRTHSQNPSHDQKTLLNEVKYLHEPKYQWSYLAIV